MPPSQCIEIGVDATIGKRPALQPTIDIDQSSTMADQTL